MYNKSCIVCSKEFSSIQPKSKVCSDVCRRKHHINTYGINSSGLSTHFLGTIHEYKSYIDLSELGVHVYMQFLPQSKYDSLILTKSGKLMTMDVKTGYKSAVTGNYLSPKHKHPVDIIAMYIKNEKRVVYFLHGEEVDKTVISSL